MAVLTPSQIKAWYQTSLRLSGYEELDVLPRRIWKTAVIHGKRALPPGFLGNLIERLTKKNAGLRGGAGSFPL